MSVDYNALQERLVAVTGLAIRYWYHEECDVELALPEGTGAVTVCFKHRRWCPGGSVHAKRMGDCRWFGVSCDGYGGRGWVEAMGRDILTALKRLYRSDARYYKPKDERLAAKFERLQKQVADRLDSPAEPK